MWRAALLGGLAGGLFAFGLARAFPPTPKPVPVPPPSEAKRFADQVIGRLKEGRTDDFLAYVRPAFAQVGDEQFARFRQGVIDTRTNAVRAYGPSRDFEFCRETPIGPSLVRVAYLEKHPGGCVLWALVVYDAPDGWQVSALSYQASESGFSLLH
ncbi:MAG: hypothetical protein ACKODX_20550 [Gemmata sp.]